MAGQIYVGNGYRKMSEKVGDLTKVVELKIEMELLEKKTHMELCHYDTTFNFRSNITFPISVAVITILAGYGIYKVLC